MLPIYRTGDRLLVEIPFRYWDVTIEGCEVGMAGCVSTTPAGDGA